MRKHNLAFIDLETTGLNLIHHEIIEIGCVITDPDLNILDEFDLKIKPENIATADPTALKVNHYDPVLWKGALTLASAMEIFTRKVKDCIMVGQNVAFDFGFLEYAFNKLELPNPMHYHRLDTISIAWAKLHKEVDVERFSLREMCERFGIVNEKAHTALSDARATHELYKKLMSL
ncbi:MAG: 3'-5' exonuclease [Candidatus Paceibacterota bacterium]